MARDEEPSGAKAPAHIVTITVNNKGVKLPKGEYTGAQIKAAAIEQGVSIEADFILSVEKGQNEQKPRILGDADPIKIHEKLAFKAVDSDDNS